MKEMELVCFFYKGPAKAIRNMGSKQIFEANNPTCKSHPTEKPVALIEHYLENSVEQGGLALDPFSGSGSLALAAINTCRRWICIEKDAEYAHAAIARIGDYADNVV